jgi:NADPH-dependent F420 reductase
VAVQFAAVGVEAVIGSRTLERAEEIVAQLDEKWRSRDLRLAAGTNETAADADVVVVATPWDGALGTVVPLAGALAGKVVVSMLNAITRLGKEMVPLIPPSGSMTAALARALPKSRVVGAFHHLPAGPWGDLDQQLNADVLVCGDDREAVAQVVGLVDGLPGLRGIEAGGLSGALAIEALTPTLLEINRRYKTHASIHLTGIQA